MIFVTVTETRGSAPRDAGTVMAVSADTIHGTIGGGALEFEAIAIARDMLIKGDTHVERRFPLGPSLGQCCGGAVTLTFSTRMQDIDGPLTPPKLARLRLADPVPLWIWGAGHVGRAVVRTAHNTGAFAITLVDAWDDKFPRALPQGVARLPCPDMPRLAAHAPTCAHHLILTYSHDVDLALCAALLKRGFASCGLIGSDTKWARFQRRLTAMGLDPTPILCPIGDKTLGKHPDMIAYGTVKTALEGLKLEATA